MPWHAPVGRYRIVVEAARYRLAFRPFRVLPSDALTVRPVAAPAGRVAVRLDYPRARENVDLTARPRVVSGGVVRFRVGSRTVEVRRRRGTTFAVRAPGGVPVSVPARGASDRFANTNRVGVRVR